MTAGRLEELVILAVVSAGAFYFFPFPYSLICFITVMTISSLWRLLLSEDRVGPRLEVRNYLPPNLLPLCLVALLALAYFARVNSRLQTPLAIVVTFYVPGSAILYLLGGRDDRPSFSFLGMAVALSVVFNGLVYAVLPLTPLSSSSYALVFLCLTLALAVVPPVKESMAAGLRSVDTHSVSFDELALLSAYAIIVIFATLVLYPTNALLKSYDITGHFTNARIAALAPAYLRSNYPFFSFNQAIVFLLSAPPAGTSLLLTYNPIFQATFALMGGLAIMFSFYSLAKSQLAGLSARAIPIVATGIFMFFGGLAWTELQNNAFGHPFQAASLTKLYAASYWDAQAGPAQFLWFWFRPVTLGVLFLVLLLSLVTTRHQKPWRAVALAVLLVTGLYFVHIPELLVFVALLLILAILKPTSMPGLKSVATGLVFACPLVALLAIEQTGLGILQLSYSVLGVFVTGSVLTYIITKFVPRPTLHVGSRAVRIVWMLSLAGYVAFTFVWLLRPLSFQSASVSALQIVPSQFYPVLLGIGGILGLLAFAFFDELRERPLLASIYLLVLFFAIGRSLSLLNYFVANTDYWERRMIPILWVPLSILGGFVLVRAGLVLGGRPGSVLQGRSRSILRGRSRSLIKVATLGLIVLLGTSSTFEGVWYGRVVESKNQLTSSELSMASYLASSVAPSHTLFPSFSETSLARFAPTVYTAGVGSLLNFQELYPVRPLLSMVNTGHGSPYILVNSQDLANPTVTTPNGYLADLLRVLPAIYSSGGTKLYSLGNITAPSVHSSTCVGASSPANVNELLAFDLLSSVRANYTLVSNLDASIFRCNSVFVGANMNSHLAQHLLSSPGDYTITVLGESSTSFFSKMFLNGTATQTMKASQLVGDGRTYNLPSSITVKEVKAADGVMTTSYYESSSGETVPLSLRSSSGNHSVTFLNLQPLVDATQPSGKTKLAIFALFRLMVEASQIQFEPVLGTTTSLGRLPVSFTSARLAGGATFETTSMVLKGASLLATVTTSSANGSVSRVTRVATGLSLYSLDGVMTVSTGPAILAGGEGFYTSATFGHTLTVSGTDLQGTISLGNATLAGLQSVDRLEVTSIGSPDLLLRTPTVTDNKGPVTLQNLVVFNAPTFSKLRASAQATLAGDVAFDLEIGDRVSFASGLSYSGSVTYSTPLAQWNESLLFYYVAPGLCVLGVALVWWYYIRRPKVTARRDADRPVAGI